jgi:hypothetical protein
MEANLSQVARRGLSRTQIYWVGQPGVPNPPLEELVRVNRSNPFREALVGFIKSRTGPWPDPYNTSARYVF